MFKVHSQIKMERLEIFKIHIICQKQHILTCCNCLCGVPHQMFSKFFISTSHPLHPNMHRVLCLCSLVASSSIRNQLYCTYTKRLLFYLFGVGTHDDVRWFLTETGLYPRWSRDARRGTAIREMSARKVSFMRAVYTLLILVLVQRQISDGHIFVWYLLCLFFWVRASHQIYTRAYTTLFELNKNKREIRHGTLYSGGICEFCGQSVTHVFGYYSAGILLTDQTI